MGGRFTVKFYLLVDNVPGFKEKYKIRTLEKLADTDYEYVEIDRSTDLLLMGLDTSVAILAQYNLIDHPKRGEVLFVTVCQKYTTEVIPSKVSLLQKLKTKLFKSDM